MSNGIHEPPKSHASVRGDGRRHAHIEVLQVHVFQHTQASVAAMIRFLDKRVACQVIVHGHVAASKDLEALATLRALPKESVRRVGNDFHGLLFGALALSFCFLLDREERLHGLFKNGPAVKAKPVNRFVLVQPFGFTETRLLAEEG